MSLTLSGKTFEPAPEGTHLAICTQMYDLGMQETKNWGMKPQIWMQWELPLELMEDGQPFTTGRRYGATLGGKSTLRKDLESWRGRKFTADELKQFNISAVAGKPCLISIVHNTEGDNTYANIAAVMAVPKGTEVPKPVNEVLVYDQDNPDAAVFAKMADWAKEAVSGTVEDSFDNAVKPDDGKDDFEDDDIPF